MLLATKKLRSKSIDKVLFALIGLALFSACSDGGSSRSETRGDPLAREIWKKMEAAEANASYVETLSPDILAQHEASVAFIKKSIPPLYPEPYLPLGLLKDKSIDPGLAAAPILNSATAKLGEKLFSETLMSHSEAHGFSSEKGLSCASCHQSEHALTDQKALSPGIEGHLTHRNTPTLWNVAYSSTLTWSNPHFPILEMQARIPLFNDDPIEMGLKGKAKLLLSRLSEEDVYTPLVKEAYGLDFKEGVKNETIDYTLLTSALAAFERTLIRFDSRFDLFLQGKNDLTAQEKLGASLFYGVNSLRSGATLGCAQCHAGFHMSDSFQYVREGRFVHRITFHKDIRTPSLRFVGQTAPYLHDGGARSLDEVLALYERGGRDSPLQGPFAMIEEERAALKAFLLSL